MCVRVCPDVCTRLNTCVEFIPLRDRFVLTDLFGTRSDVESHVCLVCGDERNRHEGQRPNNPFPSWKPETIPFGSGEVTVYFSWSGVSTLLSSVHGSRWRTGRAVVLETSGPLR